MRSLPSIAAALFLFTLGAMAEGPAKITDISAALAKARAENKMLFIEMGRENCENCQALRAMLAKKEVKLPEARFVYADVNCDDPATVKVFRRKFKVIGSTLPFVVVASPDGQQLAARSGAGTAEEFAKVVEQALAKAGR